MIVSLQMETCCLTSKSAEAPNQTSQLLFLYDQSLSGENAMKFPHKEVDKKIINSNFAKMI